MTASAAIAFATPRQAARTVRCPHCDELPTIIFRTRDEIAAELAMRDGFFARRLDRHRSRNDLLTGQVVWTQEATARLKKD